MEPKTGWGKGRSPALFKADRTRGSVCLPVVHASLLVCLPVVHTLAAFPARGSLASSLFLWSALWSCGATCCRRRGPVTSPGDASETRAEGAALPAAWCEPARPGEERRRELGGLAGGPDSGAATLAAVGTRRHDSPTTEGGAGNLHRSRGPIRSAKAHGHKGLRTLCTPLPMRGSFFCFCMTAVAPCPEIEPV